MTLRLANQFDESLDSSASNQPLWAVSTLPAKPVVLMRKMSVLLCRR